jgi:hypothetical protein
MKSRSRHGSTAAVEYLGRVRRDLVAAAGAIGTTMLLASITHWLVWG